MPNPEHHNPSIGNLAIKYPNLHKSPEVEFAADTRHQPEQKIGSYLMSLEGRHGLMGGSNHRRDIQIESYLTDEDDIPDAYFQAQARLALQRGNGHIEVTDEMRTKIAETLRGDQRAGLKYWVDYLNHQDANYPTWFKYYALRSVLDMGTYDEEKELFKKRSKGTVAPFPELNQEALAYVYDNLSKHVDSYDTNKMGGAGAKGREVLAEAKKQISKFDFNRQYSTALKQVETGISPELRAITDGEWVKYQMSSDPEDSKTLADSLHGYGTKWCTAGEATAHMQLAGGDFYIFKTKNFNDEYAVPRVAIRMEDGMVAEVRGIDQTQQLEPAFLDVVQAKLSELPGGKDYDKKIADMKLLTEIYERATDNSGYELTKDELRFLYEIDGVIEGFGFNDDPRVHELIEDRDVLEDLVAATGFYHHQISLTSRGFTIGSGLTKLHYGNLISSEAYDVQDEAYYEHNPNRARVINSLREGLIVLGDLDLEGSDIEELPAGLKVRGGIYASKTKLAEIPEDIEVFTALDVSNTLVSKLPDGLRLVESLEIDGTAVERLPNGLEVGGNLSMMHTGITKLPDDFRSVGFILNAEFSSLSELPEGFTVGHDLKIVGTPMANLPDSLTVHGGLDLTRTSVRQLGKDTYIAGGLMLGPTVEELPAGLRVGHTLNLWDSRVAHLPADISVEKNLRAESSKLESLPEGLEVPGDLILRGSRNITKLPNNMTVGGVLDITDTNITEIPEGVEVGVIRVDPRHPFTNPGNTPARLASKIQVTEP